MQTSTFISTTAIIFIFLVSASATAVKVEEVVIEKDVAIENKGKGFYLGAGIGQSRYHITLTESRYDYTDPDNPSFSFEAQALEQRDSGSLWYGGYQFNKIIAVEAAYTDYGDFSKILFDKNYSQSPESFSVYANAGYTFLNGQLRPFGIAGLGYLKRNQSVAYDRLDFKPSLVTLHYGVGVDYYPTVFKGVGLRFAYSADMHLESAFNDSGSVYAEDFLWHNYSLLFVGVQYKF